LAGEGADDDVRRERRHEPGADCQGTERGEAHLQGPVLGNEVDDRGSKDPSDREAEQRGEGGGPLESELGSGTTSWTTSVCPWLRVAARNVSSSRRATAALAALATSNLGRGPASNAP
jgi:hypothetical protein